jgi:HD superfamily phosphohydrolase YqeK
MTVLEKVLYLADKTEPFRPLYTGFFEIKDLMYTDLDRALRLAISRIMRWNRDRGEPVEQNSVEALRWIERTCMNETKGLL